MSDHGRLVWYERMIPEPDGAKAFYGAAAVDGCDASAAPKAA